MKSFRNQRIQREIRTTFRHRKNSELVAANVITVEELNVVSDTDRPLPLLGSLPAKEPGGKKGEVEAPRP